MDRTETMTIEEFERVAESLGPCELVRGEVVHMSPGGEPHSRSSIRIATMLDMHCMAEQCGRVLGNEAGVITEPDLDTVRGADIIYISHRRLPKGMSYEGFLRTPPELVVEVKGVKDTWAKLLRKVAEYHKLGVDLVWVADPKTRSIRVYPKGEKPVLMGDHETITGGKILPKFKCKIAVFFEY